MSRRDRFPQFLRSLLIAHGCLLAAVPALAGDVKEVEKALRFSRSSLDSNRFDEAENRIQEAEKNLAGLPEAELARLRSEIAALRKEKGEKELEFNAGPLLKEFGRCLDAAEHEYQQGIEGNGNAELAKEMEPQLARAEERLESENVKKWLSAQQIADIRTKINEHRALGEKAGRDIQVKRADKWLAEVEMANQELANASWDDVRNKLGYAKETTESLPESDARRAEYLGRIEKLRTQFEAGTSAVDRNAQITTLHDFWKQVQDSYGKESEGWEDEPAPDYDRFVKALDIGMKRTLDRSSLLRRVTESTDYQDAKKTLSNEPSMQELVKELDAATEDAAAKFSTSANGLLERAESDHETNRDTLTSALQALENALENRVAPTKESQVALARTKSLLQKIADDGAAKVAAREKLTAEMTAKAKELWPKLVAANESASGGFVAIDPVAVVDDIDRWKGKVVRLANANNRAGWDYQHGDYDLIVPMSGIPIGGQFDPKLRDEIQRISDSTGIRFDGRIIEDVIGVIDGHCRIQGTTYSQLLQEHVPTVNFKAPLLRVIAIKAGPYAVSIEGDAMDVGALSGSRSDSSEADSSGMPWKTLLVLGAAIVALVKKRDVVLAFLRARSGRLPLESSAALAQSARGWVERSLETAKKHLPTKPGAPGNDR